MTYQEWVPQVQVYITILSGMPFPGAPCKPTSRRDLNSKVL